MLFHCDQRLLSLVLLSLLCWEWSNGLGPTCKGDPSVPPFQASLPTVHEMVLVSFNKEQTFPLQHGSHRWASFFLITRALLRKAFL